MDEGEKESRTPINISVSEVNRAFKKVEEYKKLIKKGKTREEIFEDLLNLIEVDD
jgi:flagellar hook-associated protein FlgK